jgi:hypothetical protein
LPATSRIGAAGAAVCAANVTGAHNAPMVRAARKKDFIRQLQQPARTSAFHVAGKLTIVDPRPTQSGRRRDRA